MKLNQIVLTQKMKMALFPVLAYIRIDGAIALSDIPRKDQKVLAILEQWLAQELLP